MPARLEHRRSPWRIVLTAILLAGLVLATPARSGEAHTCTPDPTVSMGGQLVVPRASGLAVVQLPDRVVRSVPIPPSLGITTGVASAKHASLLAVPRFWRPPDHKVGGQDILLIDQSSGAPVMTLERSGPGEVLGSPAWLPDGSLVYERRTLSGSNEVVKIERAQPGQPGEVLAENAYGPGVSPDGSLLALLRFAGTEKLYVRPIDGGPERAIVDNPRFLAIAFPRFSPDGAWIAFAAASDPVVTSRNGGNSAPRLARTESSAVPSSATRGVEGWAQPLLGTVQSLLTTPTAHAHGVPWDVWVVRPDGSDLRQVTTYGDDDSSVTWSPDGRWIATFSAEAIHVISFDGSENYCVGNEGGYGGFEWLP